MIETIIVWLQQLIETIGPVGLAIATCIESFFAPIPSETILVVAGTTAHSYPEVLIMVVFATIGSYIGTLPFYLIGGKSKQFVVSFINKWGKYLFLKLDDVERAEKLFEKHGEKFVFFGRFIPIVRSVISIPAGICHMNFKIYTIYTIIAASIWNIFMLSIGFFIRDKYQVVLDAIDSFDNILIVILLIVFVVFITLRIVGINKESKNTPTA